MKKSNLILQAAIAAALASSSAAYAGSLSGTTNFATEVFGASQTNAAEIIPGAVTYTFNTPGGIVVNPTGNIYMYFREAGGLFTAAPAVGDFSFAGGIAGLTVTAVGISTDSTTVRATLNNGTTNNVTIGVGGQVILTPAATRAFNNVTTTLATTGQSVTLQASVSAAVPSLPNTGTALPADLDNGVSTALNMATSAQAITSAALASSAFGAATVPVGTAETQRIDLTATAPSSRFTTPGGTLSNTNSATIINLGGFRFTNAAGTQALLDGTTDYTIATRGSNMSGTVTGVFKAGSTVHIDSGAGCATATLATATLNSTTAPTVATFTGAALPVTATDYFVCYTVAATTPAIPVTQPTLALTVNKTAGTDQTDTVSATLYNLQLNGQQVDVRSYVPVGNTGYTSWVRVINTGTVAAPVSGQFLYADGTVGTAGTIISNLAAGGSMSLNADAVEAGIGAPTGGAAARPRLRVTAPTNGMQVQSFISNPDNSITDMTGAQ